MHCHRNSYLLRVGIVSIECTVTVTPVTVTPDWHSGSERGAADAARRLRENMNAVAPFDSAGGRVGSTRAQLTVGMHILTCCADYQTIFKSQFKGSNLTSNDGSNLSMSALHTNLYSLSSAN